MRVDLEYTLTLYDENGKALWKRRLPSHSFVQQYLKHLRSFWTNATFEPDVRDITNNLRTLAGPPNAYSTITMDINGPGSITSWGPVVGSVSTPVGMTDYKLGTQIDHGSGAGQLNYGATTVFPMQQSGLLAWVRITRSFSNGSGAVVTVRELGIYCRSKDTANSEQYYLLIRDIPSPAIDVPNGQSLAVDYIVKISV